MTDAKNGHTRRTFAQWRDRRGVLLEHIVSMTQIAETGCRLKRIQTDVCLQHLDRPQRLAGVCQDETEAEIGKIRIERDGAFKFGDRFLVPTPQGQYPPQLSMTLTQMPLDPHSL